MHIGWPQGIYLALVFLSLGIGIANHGRPRPPYNGGLHVVGVLIVLPLLYWGGFFS
jgi:hypothetical protein